jgi:FixJ family two-component response regulator
VILRPIEVFLSSIVGFQGYFGMKIGEMIWTTCPGVQMEINLKNFLGIDDKKNEIINAERKNMKSLSTDPKMPSKEIILVVDDEAGPRESLRMILKPLYEVHTASGGQEALGLIRNKDIAVVTLDLNMPGLSGIDVLKEIRNLRPDTEVIVITGYGTLKNAQEAIRFGAGDFISKPFNVADVISIVEKSFERRSFNLKIKSLVERIQGLRSTVHDA